MAPRLRKLAQIRPIPCRIALGVRRETGKE
jgi:hypothetical protein